MSLFNSTPQSQTITPLNQTAMTADLVLEGELDALAIEALRDELEQLGKSTVDVDLDFSSVTFIDSSGIGALVFLFKRLRTSNCILRLHNVNGQPLELIQYLRIDKSIQVNG
ncbi:MAG: STAS domain-containing protein [Marinomonas sp.]